MPFNPKEHHRRSVRLKGYDYSLPGAYFITICTFLQHCLFGQIVEGATIPNQLGAIVAEEWARSPQIRPALQLDEWIVMPNHIHGIVIVTALDPVRVGARAGLSGAPKCLESGVEAHSRAPLRGSTNTGTQNRYTRLHRKPRSLSSFISGFKSAVTTRVNSTRRTPHKPVWQINYHEHIIRNEESLRQIRKYIRANPWMWKYDKDNPNRSSVVIDELGDDWVKKSGLSKEDLRFILEFDDEYRGEDEEDP